MVGLMKAPKDCHTCLGPCDPEVHEATMAVRQWFRGFVLLGLEPVQIAKPAKKLRPTTLPWARSEPVEASIP